MAESALVALFRKPGAFPAMVGAVVVIAGFFIWYAMQPAQGTWRTGICRVFREFEYAYPITFEDLTVAEDRSSARIYFAEKNPFGNERIIQQDCEYQIDETRGTIRLARLSFDRKPVPKERVALYNRMIPALLTQDLDLDFPKELPRSLDRLKR